VSTRSDKFKELYPKRLEKAKKIIRSIGKLSNRSNYVYEDEEVDEVLSTLMFEVKSAISKFGKGTVEERFKRYLEIDLKQIKVIKETDPELYKFILRKLEGNKGADLLKQYIEDHSSNKVKALDKNKIENDKLDVPSFLHKQDLMNLDLRLQEIEKKIALLVDKD